MQTRRIPRKMLIKIILILLLAIIALVLKGNRLSLSVLIAQLADMLAYGLVGDSMGTGDN